jgi:hypothetical protein
MAGLRSLYQRGLHTSTASIQRLHIKDVDAVHLAQDLKSLQTSALLEVGRDGAGRSSGREEVRVVLNLYSSISSARPHRCHSIAAGGGDVPEKPLSGVAGTLYLFSALQSANAHAYHPVFPSLPCPANAHPPPSLLNPRPRQQQLPPGTANGRKLTSGDSAGEGALDSWAGGRATGRVNSALEEHG